MANIYKNAKLFTGNKKANTIVEFKAPCYFPENVNIKLSIFLL